MSELVNYAIIYNKILLNAIFICYAMRHDQTKPNQPQVEKYQPNPTQSNQTNPIHGFNSVFATYLFHVYE
jgi:hypothetical protein